MIHWLLLGFFCALAVPQSELLAEQDRLRNEMRVLTEKNLWKGVEKLYLELLSLEKKGAILKSSDHVQGAASAREQGNIKQTIVRLRKATSLSASKSEQNWLQSLESTCAKVQISHANTGTSNSLQMKNRPFSPDLLAGLKLAEVSLQKKGRFSGYLPIGSYSFGGKSFEVKKQQINTIKLSKTFVRKGNLLAMHSGLEVIHMGRGSAENSPEPLPFTATGLSLGLTHEVEKNGWVIGSAGRGFAAFHPQALLTGLHVNALVGVRRSFGTIFVGPAWSVAFMRRQGFLAPDVAVFCAGGCTNADLLRENSIISGTSTSFGGVTGYRWEKSSKIGFEVQGGLRKDEYRWYSWGGLYTSFRLGR